MIRPAGACLALLLAAAAPARADDDLPDLPGMHVVEGSPAREIGACMIDIQAWAAYSRAQDLTVAPWVYQAYSAFKREIQRTQAGLDGAWTGMHAESDELDAIHKYRGARDLAQAASDRVQACGGYVLPD